MKRPQTIRLSPKAYPFDYARFALVIAGGTALVLALYVALA